MKKKLLCMILCIVMVLTFVLSSCTTESDTTDEVDDDTTTTSTSDRDPVTLTLWLPCEEGTTDEAVQAVEDAINSILKSSYTTAIELKVYTEEAYAEAVEERLTTIETKAAEDAAAAEALRKLQQEQRKAGITTTTSEETTAEETEAETIVNDYGISELKYPEVDEYQFDIFLITSYDDYLDLIERDALSELDSSLSNDSKILKSYIYPTFLTAAKNNGTTYCIPNNHGLGEYKFLLVNKELAEKYNYDYTTLTTIGQCEDFIYDVNTYEDSSEVAALLSWVDAAGMTYWSEDGDWSVLASLVSNSATFNTKSSIGSIFDISAYKTQFKLMKAFEEAGCIAEDPDSVETFAVGVISGDYSDIAQYEDDYYVSIYEYPRATQEDVFAAAFAVSSYTADLDRAMEVIVEINTNSEIRNLLQYGIEGTNYELDDEGKVVRLNNEYMMNILYTGNTYVAYPEEGMDINQWEYDKQKNTDSILSPFLYVYGLKNSSNESYYEAIETLSAEIYEQLMSISLDEVDDKFKEFNSLIRENEYFAAMISDEDWEYAAAYIYSEFYAENYATEEESE
ncbi:MAG: ABC transporter substrate-binding protein [Firmicutes bacterium]|nr:ABC transporter substrate-binding protein [Bacillota bacterium]